MQLLRDHLLIFTLVKGLPECIRGIMEANWVLLLHFVTCSSSSSLCIPCLTFISHLIQLLVIWFYLLLLSHFIAIFFNSFQLVSVCLLLKKPEPSRALWMLLPQGFIEWRCCFTAQGSDAFVWTGLCCCRLVFTFHINCSFQEVKNYLILSF